MATRTAYPATESAGDILTTTNFDKLPGGAIGYASATGNQGSITAEADVSGLSVTVTVNTSRLIKVSAVVFPSDTVATDTVVLWITDGSNNHLQGHSIVPPNTSPHFITTWVILSPSAGSNTYKARISRTGSGTVTNNASATQPSFILVEDIGPAF